jgi:putative NADH-flavin reductase
MALENETISEEDRLRLVNGDVFDISAVKQAVQGQEAVICTLGSNSLTKTTVRGEGTANIVKAMEEEHVDRLIVVSAMGTGESWSELSFTNKLFYATLLRSSRRDHEAQETAVRKSNLNWTIVRPSGLTEGALTGSYAIGETIQGKSSQITRADVAHAILKELDEDTFVHMAVTITN